MADTGSLMVNMRERISKCRRLAAGMTDKQTIEALWQMADEIEADLKKLEADAAASAQQTIQIDVKQ